MKSSYTSTVGGHAMAQAISPCTSTAWGCAMARVISPCSGTAWGCVVALVISPCTDTAWVCAMARLISPCTGTIWIHAMAQVIIPYTNTIWGCAMAGVISHGSVIVDAWVESHASHVGFVVARVTPEQVFLQVLQISLVSFYQCSVLTHSSNTDVIYIYIYNLISCWHC
jgi:hypothetical protein